MGSVTVRHCGIGIEKPSAPALLRSLDDDESSRTLSLNAMTITKIRSIIFLEYSLDGVLIKISWSYCALPSSLLLANFVR